MKNLRKIVLVLLLALALTIPAYASRDVVEPTEAGYVADYANILSDSTEEHICSVAANLDAATGGQIAVVTIDFLNELDSEQYAYTLLNQWGVGDADKNNGVVVLLVPGEGKFWIAQGSGIEDELDSGRLNTIIDNYLADDFDNGDYDRAATQTFDAIVDWFESYYGVTVSESGYSGGSSSDYGYYEPEYSETTYTYRGPSMIKIILCLVILAFIISRLFGGSGRRGGGRSRRRSSGSNFWTWMTVNSVLNSTRRHNHHRHTPPRQSPPRNDHFGGFSGGHSSGFGGSSRSSGGRSGGFGGFSGGGSRGGGAGRK